MQRIIVTPAGRKRYLEPLFMHLQAQKDSFDEWHLWMNTSRIEDIGYAERLAARHPWIHTIYLDDYEGRPTDNMNIHRFFPLDAADPECVYLRLDDDVVWLQPGFVDAMFTYRQANPEPFLVYANIVNNAVCTYLHQHGGALTTPQYNTTQKKCGYFCTDPVGWQDPEFAEAVHREFLADPTSDTWRNFNVWHLCDYERCSINAISWLGSEFATFEGKVGADEEQWLSVDHPKEIQRHNVILGSAMCVHFSFHTQREHLDNTDILEDYLECAPATEQTT